MRRRAGSRIFVVATLIAAFGCTGGEDAGDSSAGGDTVTRRQRDSLIGESVLPGAQGVRAAMRAADSAEARMRRLDSIGGI